MSEPGGEVLRNLEISIESLLVLPRESFREDRISLSVLVYRGSKGFETTIQEALEQVAEFPTDQIVVPLPEAGDLKKSINQLRKLADFTFEIALSDNSYSVDMLDLFAEAENVFPYLLSQDIERNGFFIRDCCQLEIAFKLSFPNPVLALSAVTAAIHDANQREIVDILSGSSKEVFGNDELVQGRDYLLAVATSDSEGAIGAILK